MENDGKHILKKDSKSDEQRIFDSCCGGNTQSIPTLGNETDRTDDSLFKDVATEWMIFKKAQLKESSISKYSNILKSYLIPSYGNMRIKDISRHDVSSYSIKMLITGGHKGIGLAPKTVNSTLSVMKSIFKYAEREKRIIVADIKDIGVKQPQKPLRILTLNEQQRICCFLYENINPCNLGILLCMYTGIRIGELCALRWSDINTDDQTLHIHQTMQRIQTPDDLNSKTKVVVLSPKSDCSIRRIPIPDEMFQLLLKHHNTNDNYLLTGIADKYIEPRTLENKFKRIATACDIHDIKFHALRHTFATRCVERGFDIKSLSEILGHSSVNITLNRYVHPSMALKKQNMNKLSGFITNG